MRITERRLRKLIRSVLIESKSKRFSVGDVVLVRHTDGWSDGSPGGVAAARRQGIHAMDWGGCVGVIKRCNPDGTCDIEDPEKELDDLTNLPMKDSYIELIGNSVRDDSGLHKLSESNIFNDRFGWLSSLNLERDLDILKAGLESYDLHVCKGVGEEKLSNYLRDFVRPGIEQRDEDELK